MMSENINLLIYVNVITYLLTVCVFMFLLPSSFRLDIDAGKNYSQRPFEKSWDVPFRTKTFFFQSSTILTILKSLRYSSRTFSKHPKYSSYFFEVLWRNLRFKYILLLDSLHSFPFIQSEVLCLCPRWLTLPLTIYLYD